ncbi:aldehyde dehydrogenase [Irpex rosettiformis]|uniref:Aldehyde dehydrogenase n=1 Tax=Irpex rosettiformis TaxID=378272 RepID=A0ACB8TTS8_9APHY|nr:aldehyde dehydrogenase [Irpex rosettiformis]
MTVTQLPIVPLFIKGQKTVPNNSSTYQVRSPTGKVLSHVVSASSSDAKAAIEVAQAAFDSWRTLPPIAKETIFRRAITVFSNPDLRAKITETAHQETGVSKPWADILNYYVDSAFSEACDTVYSLRGEVLPSNSGALASIVQKVPYGVIFIISPWNAPVTLTLLSCLPAIAAGNTVVLKTSECSPASQLIVADILKEAGLPDGVFNVIHTSPEDSPSRVAEIIAHPLVRKIGFTGSERVGKIIAGEAAKHLKPCVLELGGKAPAIVLNDANIDAAARGIISGAFVHSGQACIGTERVIVQRGASVQFIEKIKSLASKIKASDQSQDPRAQLGCVFSVGSAQNIISMVKEAIASGAELLHGDLKYDGPLVQPHIVLGAKPGTRLWDRESFGPVFTVAIVDTIDQAVNLANSSTYSLTSSLWTESYDLAFTLSPRIRAGKVIVNSTTLMSESRFSQAALGGSSGYGSFSPGEFVVNQLLSIHKPEGQRFIVADY